MLQLFSRWLFSRHMVQDWLQPRLRAAFAEHRVEWRTSREGGTVADATFFSRDLWQLGGLRLSLHAFAQADAPGAFHSHPARALRLILSGGYLEERLITPAGRLPAITQRSGWQEGQFGWVQPDYVHRIDLVWPARKDACAYSLWLRWPKSHPIRVYQVKSSN